MRALFIAYTVVWYASLAIVAIIAYVLVITALAILR